MRLTILAALLVAARLHAQPAGRVEERVVTDRTFGRARHVWVYTPPGYSRTSDARTPDGYPLLVVFDGRDHLAGGATPVPHALDSLLAAGKAPPFVALLVDDSSFAVRTAELGNNPRFVAFLANELLPWLRAGWNVTRDPHRTIVLGESAGGLGAAFVAFERPDLFGNVVSQSGAFWRGAAGSDGAPYEWLTGEIARSPRRDVRFVLDVGALETHAVLGGAGPVMIEANRRLRDALRAKGYDVAYTEVPGGVHAPEAWRLRTASDLMTIVSGWTRDTTSR